MYVKAYYNFTLTPSYLPAGIRRGYKPNDKLIEVWDGYTNITSTYKTAEYVFNLLTTEDSLPKILGLVDMTRGDVIYFPEKEIALARTINWWKLVKDFKIPPPQMFGFGYQNRDWNRNS